MIAIDTSPPWTRDRVDHRVREAALTLRALPGGRIAPARRLVFWPEVVREAAEAYGYTAARAAPGAQASAAAVSRMDRTIGWLSNHLAELPCIAAGLAPDSAMVVWSRATGISWEMIGKLREARYGRATRGGGPSLSIPRGNNRTSLTLIQRRALDHLAAVLNRRAGELVDQTTLDTEGARASAWGEGSARSTISRRPAPRDLAAYTPIRDAVEAASAATGWPVTIRQALDRLPAGVGALDVAWAIQDCSWSLTVEQDPAKPLEQWEITEQ